MTLTSDPADPRLGEDTRAFGQNGVYLVLSPEERAKGFVRPVRHSYRHVGIRPQHELRDLTDEERERYRQFGYVKFEAYPGEGSVTGRFWTLAQLSSGCGTVTTMGFCVGCNKHLALEEFAWEPDGESMDPARQAETRVDAVEVVSPGIAFVLKNIRQFPHCDQRILHAPGECRYCDSQSEWQALRVAWGIAFTGKPAAEGELPCPADHARGDQHQLWPGNRPTKEA